MKKQNLFYLSAISLFALVALWSCQDDFTEEDLLNKQASLGLDSIDLSILVYNASTSFTSAGSGGSDEEEECYDCGSNTSGRMKASKGVSSLTVTISKNGKSVSATTDENGIALFKGLQPGTIVGSVSGAGVTTTNFVVSVKEGENANGSNEPTTNAGAIIPVFETEGENVATVTGYATCELNLLNSTRENVPNGTKVSFSIDTSSDGFEELLSALLTLGVLPESMTSATVDELSFEGNFVATVTNGQYSIDLPVSHHGLDYTYSFADFTADQQIAVYNFTHEAVGSLRSVQTLSTQFGKAIGYVDYSQVYIPYLHGIQLDVDAPPAAGSGATATIRLLPRSLDNGGGFTVLSSGSGYTPNSTTIPVTISGGDFDNTVTGQAPASITAISDAQGRIVGITGALGFGYRSRATLTIGGGGSGAVVRVNYSSTVAPLFGTAVEATSGTVLTAGGSGYALAPDVVFVGFNFAGEQVTETTSSTVSNGSVVDFSEPFTAFRTTPTVTFRPQSRVNALVKVTDLNTSTGSITSVSIDNSGSAYNPLAPPAITVRDLRNTGTGAQLVAVTSAFGSLNSVTIVNGGSGYPTLGGYGGGSYYANYPTYWESFETSASSVITLKPGETRNINAHYGTGVHPRGLEGDPYFD